MVERSGQGWDRYYQSAVVGSNDHVAEGLDVPNAFENEAPIIYYELHAEGRKKRRSITDITRTEATTEMGWAG